MVLPQTVRRRNEPQTASIPDMGGVQTCPATLPCFWLSEAIVTPSWACLPFSDQPLLRPVESGPQWERKRQCPQGAPLPLWWEKANSVCISQTSPPVEDSFLASQERQVLCQRLVLREVAEA